VNYITLTPSQSQSLSQMICKIQSNRWRFGLVGNVFGRINEVNQRRARLVLGWATIGRRVNHLNQSPRWTQPGHPFASRCNDFRQKHKQAHQAIPG